MDAPFSPSDYLNLDSDVADEPAMPICFGDEEPETLPSSPPISTGYDEEKAFRTLRDTSENWVYQVLGWEDMERTVHPALTRNAAWNDAHVNKANVDRCSSNYIMSTFIDPQDDTEFANIKFANLVHATSTYPSQEEPRMGDAIEAVPRSSSSVSDEMIESSTHSGAFMHTFDINSDINQPLFVTDKELPLREDSVQQMNKIMARNEKQVSMTVGERAVGVNVVEAFAVIASTQEVKELSKPLSCSKRCKQSFNSYEELTRHLDASPGHRPFVSSEKGCIFSALGFQFESVYRCHITKEHHPRGAYMCEICDPPKYLARTDTLKRHTSVTHTESGQTKNKRLRKKKRQCKKKRQ